MGEGYRKLKKAQAAMDAVPDWRDPADRIAAADVQRLRLDIRAKLETGAREASSSGKPLQILVGEDHYDNRAFLKELIVIDEARRIGIRDLALEAPGDVAGRAPPPGIATQYTSIATLPGLFPDMATYGVDNGRSGNGPQSRKMDDARAASMADGIGSLARGSVSIMGLGHVDAVAADPALAGATIVALDLSDGGERLSSRAAPLTMRGDAREYGYADIVTFGLGARQAAAMLARQTQQGLVSAPGAVAAQVRRMETARAAGQLTDAGTLSLAAGYSEMYRASGETTWATQAVGLHATLQGAAQDIAAVSSFTINGSPRAMRDDAGLRLSTAPSAPQTSWATRLFHRDP